MIYANKFSYAFKTKLTKEISDKYGIQKKTIDENNYLSKLEEMVNNYDSLVKEVEALFYIGREGDKKPNDNLKIKYRWLKTNFPEIHYYCLEENKTIITDKYHKPSSFINCLLKENSLKGSGWLNANKELIQEFKDCIKTHDPAFKRNYTGMAPIFYKGRKSQFSYLINTLSGRINFKAMYDLLNDNCILCVDGHTSYTAKIKELSILSKTINNELNQLKEYFTYSTTIGRRIFKSSFNYYTLRKEPHIYTGELKTIEDQMKNYLNNGKFIDWTLLKEVGYIEYLEKIKGINDYRNLDIHEQNEMIKQFKGLAKSKFIEYLKDKNFEINDYRNLSEVEISNKLKSVVNKDQSQFLGNYCMFACEFTELEKMYKTLKEIDAKATEYNNEKDIIKKDKLKKELDRIRKEKGKFFNFDFYKREKKDTKRENKITQKYFNLNEGFKKFAMYRGKLITDLNSIERQRIESNLTTHYSYLHKNDVGQFEVWLCDLNKAQTVFKTLQNIENDSRETSTFYYLHSITLNAIEKQLFKSDEKANRYFSDKSMIEDPRFLPFKTQLENYQEKPSNKYDLNPDETNEIKYIRFLKDVLLSDYIYTELGLKHYNGFKEEVIDKEHNKIEDFRKDLERICYKWIKKTISVTSREYNNLDADYKLPINNPEFANLDFGRTREIADGVVKFNNNTTDFKESKNLKVFNQFFTELDNPVKFETRINPEVSFYLRTVIDKEPNKKNKVPKCLASHTNKYATEQLTIQFNVLERSSKYRYNNSFEDFDTIKKCIDKNNNDYYQKRNRGTTIIDKLYGRPFIGIDRGKNKLMSLSVLEFKDEYYEINAIEQNMYKFKPITVYSIKKGDELKNQFGLSKDDIIRIHKNPSLKMVQKITNKINKHEDYLDSAIVNCLESSAGKVIDGRIIMDGDMFTFFKTILATLIYELYLSISSSDFKLDEIDKIEVDLINNKMKLIYTKINGEKVDGEKFLNDKEFAKLKDFSIENITDKHCANFKEYLKDDLVKDINVKLAMNLEGIKKSKTDGTYTSLDHREKLLNLNRYRNNLINNQLGIITQIMKEYNNNVFLCLELLAVEGGTKIGTQDQQFQNGRKIRLELTQQFDIALLSKLNKIDNAHILPSYKQFVSNRIQSKIVKEIMIERALFVDVDETSKICPVCGAKVEDNHKAHSVCGYGVNNIINSSFSYKHQEILKEVNKYPISKDFGATIIIAKRGLKMLKSYQSSNLKLLQNNQKAQLKKVNNNNSTVVM